MIDPFYSGDRFTLYNGDCLAVLAQMEACSVDAVVTDPPAGIGFMGKEWDHHKGGRDVWVAWLTSVIRECLRVLKPGGHALVWALPRTSHWTGWAIESAGFEVRDRVSHLFGTGFPKSLDVSKAIDRMRDDNAQRQAVGLWLRQQREAKGLTQKTVAAFWPSATGELTGCVANWELGFNCPTWDQWLTLKEVIGFDGEMDSEVWRLNGRKGTPGEAWLNAEVVNTDPRWNEASGIVNVGQGERQLVVRQIKAPATNAAKQWNGWGTAMKPAVEDWWWATKPLNAVPSSDTITEVSNLLEAVLWFNSPVKFVEESLRLSPQGPSAEQGSVRWLVAAASTLASLEKSDLTVMFKSLETVRTYWNIVWLWSAILDALYSPANTFTIETKTSQTIALKTLSYYLSEVTRHYTIPARWHQSGLRWNALDVDNDLSGMRRLLSETHKHSVQDNATTISMLGVQSVLANFAASLSLDIRTISEDFAPLNAGIGLDPVKLNPNCEDWWLCRKPLDGTVAANVLKHGTGALNIAGCRVRADAADDYGRSAANASGTINAHDGFEGKSFKIAERDGEYASPLGRWPAHITHDGSDEVVGLFPETSDSKSGGSRGASQIWGSTQGAQLRNGFDDSGSAARFFYCAKPDKQDREAGLQDLPLRSAGDVTDRTDGSDGLNSPRAGAGRTSGARNVHPTIKSTELMRWLCRLITPPCGLVLDPFCGSGSTGKAAMLEGFRFIGIELSTEYCELAQRRIEAVTAQQGLFTPEQLAATQDDEPAQSGLFATVGE